MYNPTSNPLARGFFGTRRPRVIAHRGSSGTCPENTIVSFQRGVDDGAEPVGEHGIAIQDGVRRCRGLRCGGHAIDGMEPGVGGS